jgi:hypothetical protein
VKFNRENNDHSQMKEKTENNDKYDVEEEETDGTSNGLSNQLLNGSAAHPSSLGLRFFRLRLLELLQSMFTLEPIHFADAFHHPRYRLLRRFSDGEITFTEKCKRSM